MRKVGYSLAAVIPAGLLGWLALRGPSAPLTTTPAPATAASSAAPAASTPPHDPNDDHDDDRSYVFRIPSGDPTALSCEEARTIVEQVRAGLAYAPESVQANAL